MKLANAQREPRPCKSLESAFQKLIVRLTKLQGWRVYWTWNSKNSPADWSDLVLVRLPITLFQELKRDDRLSRVIPEQWLCLENLAPCGLDAKVWSPEDWTEIQHTLSKVRQPVQKILPCIE